MPTDTFNKRFKELVKDLSDTELGAIMGVTADTARKMRNGDIRSLKLHAALRLARKLSISLWYLAGEPEPNTPAPRNTSAASRKNDAKGKVDETLTLRREITELRERVSRLENTKKEKGS